MSFFSNLQQYVSNSVANFSPKRFSLSGRGDSVPGASHPHTGSVLTAASTGSFDDQQGPINVSTVLPGMQMTNQSIRTGTVSSGFEVGSTSSSRPLGPKAVPPILNERSKSLRVVSFHAAADANCPLTPSSQRRTNSTSRASSWKELPMPRDLLPHEKNAAKGAGGQKLKNSLDQDMLYWKLRPSFCVQGSGELRRTSWPQFAITGSGVQEADGSFFESFTALGWKQENRRLQALREEEQDRTAACNMTASGDYSTAITPLPPLSQQHPTITPKELEQLYVEVLYTVRHKIGAHSAQYPHHYQEDLFQYAQSAFSMTAEDHRRCLAIASEEKPPIVVLNVVVIEAEGLEAKDPNGYSDPYCMLGIQPGNATTSTTPCLSTSSRETPPESPLPCGGGSAPKSDDDTFLVTEDRPMLTSERRGSLVSVPQLEKLKKHHSFRLSFKRKEPTHNRKDREQRDSLNSALPAKFIRATSVKPQTLNPKWIEKFRFDIDDVTSDILHLDIWDHDDEYSVLDAVSKLNEVRGVKGLGRFFKQIAQSARSGNQDDFLGCVNIPIQDIPSTGMECWYKLEGRSQRSTIQGRIRLKLFLSTREDFGTSEEDNWTELKQQEQLHSIFMDYELSRQKGGASQWAGDLPPLGQTILHQHAIQGDVTILQSAVVRWIAYARKLLSQPLHYSLLHSLLQDLDAKWSKESLSREEEEALAESFNMFVEHSLTLLRKVRQVFSPSNKSTVGRLEHLLKCLVYLSNMKAFWKCCPFNKEIRGEIITAVRKGTLEWYSEQFHKWTQLPIISALTLAQSRDTLIQGLIHLTNALCVDFQWALQIYDPLFQKIAGVPYFLIVYKQIDKMVGQDFGPRIEELCRNLAVEDMADNGDPNRMTIGTPIFELYVALQDLLKFQEHVPVEDRRSLQPAQYHEWFTLAVNRWLAVAYNKAYYRIQKALELDAMTNVEPYMKMTTSAIDTTSCFYQVREFWKQLAWPDPFTAYPLLYKIVEIIAVGASQYAESVHARLQQAGFYDEGKLTPFSEEVFMALNNLEHVRHALETLPEDLQLEQVLAVVEMTVNGYPMNSNSYANLGTDMRKLSVGNMSRSSPSVGNVGITYDTGARQALLSLLEGSLRECDTKTLRILGEITEKVRPELKKSVFHLAWSPDSLPAEEAIAPLLNTLDLHLTALHTNLLQAAFHKALLALWEVIILELWAQAETSTSEKLNIFFERLHKSLEILLDFLHADGRGLPVESLRTVTYTRVSEMIAFHKTTTEQLIRLYYMERLEDQQRVEMVEFGVLSVRCYFNHDSLCVEVLSARDVIPLDPNGFSDPFVIVELLPRRVFAHCSEQQTTVQKKTLNPLFDECFEFPVTLEQCRAEGAMILFTVMDYDVLTANDFAGEAFLSLNSIPGVAGNASADNFHGLKPVDLILMHQKQKNHPILSVLETRTWDKPAQEFVKKQKERCGA